MKRVSKEKASSTNTRRTRSSASSKNLGATSTVNTEKKSLLDQFKIEPKEKLGSVMLKDKNVEVKLSKQIKTESVETEISNNGTYCIG